MEKKVVLRKPKWLRRFSSAFLDLLIAFIVALLLSFATKPLGMAIFDGKNARETFNEAYVSTHLYEYNDNMKGTSSDVIIVTDITSFDENITYFYENCTDGKLFEYVTKKSNRPDLFKYDNENDVYIEVEYDPNNDIEKRTDFTIFYNEVIEEALDKYLDSYLSKSDDFIKAITRLNLIDYFSLLISATISLLLVYLLVPFIDKEYRTIGKIAFKLKVVSKINPNLTPTKLQILFRQIVLIFFEYVLTISTIGIFGIPLPFVLMVSIVMVLVTKYNQSFHDVCCSTFLIDDYQNNNAMNANEKYEITFINVEEGSK